MSGSSEVSAAGLSIGGVAMCFEKIEPHGSYGLVNPNSDLVCGDLDQHGELVSEGQILHRHHVLLQPTPQEMDTLLPLMGFDAVSNDLEDAMPSFAMVIDRVAKVHTYATSYVMAWILRGQKGRKPWSLELQIGSLVEAETGSVAYGDPTGTTAPYPFVASTFNVFSAARVFDRFALGVDRKAVPRFNNGATADIIVPTENEIYLGVSTPYTSDEMGIYTSLIGASRVDGSAATLGFARGSDSTVFTMANVKAAAKPPAFMGAHEEVRLDQYYNVFADGTTRALSVAHTSA